MAIRLIALDLDGTLLTSEKTISPGDRAAVEEAIARGVVVVLVTGRPAQGVPQEVLDLPGVRYVVSSNGATIRDVITGEFLLETHLAAETALEVLAASDHVPMIREAFRAGVGYLSQEDYDVLCARYEGAMLAYVLDTRQVVPGTLADFLRDDPRPIEERFVLTDSEETKLDLQRTLSALPGIAFADPFPRDLEVMAGGIDKGEGLRFLLDRLGVAPDQAMALGDGGSDLPMLRLAGIGVAMGNSTQAVKDGADWVTSSCDENGVARAIEKFVLNK